LVQAEVQVNVGSKDSTYLVTNLIMLFGES